QRLRYPDNHIEADNRLSWFLGTLEKEYGDAAFYVHLLREPEAVARSLVQRGKRSIIFAYAWGVLQYYDDAEALGEAERYEIGLQYCQAVNDNIAAFLASKPRQMTIWLHDVRPSFARFWDAIGAEGNLEVALAEWDVRHNAARNGKERSWSLPRYPGS